MTPETIGRKESTSYSEQKTEALGESCHKGTELFIIVAMVVFFFFYGGGLILPEAIFLP